MIHLALRDGMAMCGRNEKCHHECAKCLLKTTYLLDDVTCEKCLMALRFTPKRYVDALELRAKGMTWKEVGDRLDVSAGRARQLASKREKETKRRVADQSP